MAAFLVDNNLPPSLVTWFAKRGIQSVHVKGVGHAGTSDVDVWQYACANSLAILTKDGDFDRFALQAKGKVTPVVRLTIGNATKTVLFNWLEDRVHILQAVFEANEHIKRVIVID